MNHAYKDFFIVLFSYSLVNNLNSLIKRLDY